MTCAELIRRLEAFDVAMAGHDSLEETKNVLLEMNQQQLDAGVRSDGELIHWLKDSHYPYTPAYAKRKARRGGEIRFVNLKVSETGFRKTEVVSLVGDEIQYQSSIKLGDYLAQNYGSKIFGTTNENKEIYTKDHFFPAFKQKIQYATGLVFARSKR